MPKDKVIQLINPGGRVIDVKPGDVNKMLARGFVKAHDGQTHRYNPIFDRRKAIKTPPKVLNEKISHYRRYLDVGKI